MFNKFLFCPYYVLEQNDWPWYELLVLSIF